MAAGFRLLFYPEKRPVIDCIDRINRSGGIEEIVKS